MDSSSRSLALKGRREIGLLLWRVEGSMDSFVLFLF